MINGILSLVYNSNFHVLPGIIPTLTVKLIFYPGFPSQMWGARLQPEPYEDYLRYFVKMYSRFCNGFSIVYYVLSISFIYVTKRYIITIP